MRDIKFKFWFKGRGSFIRYHDYAVKQNGTVMIKEEEGGSWFECVKDSFDVLQYAGRKDKSGKEIYCGDLLKSGRTSLIYQVTWDEESASFTSLCTDPEKDFCMNPYAWLESEIIGNIYENKELLETE